MFTTEIQRKIDEVVTNYEGDGRVLESAIGALYFGYQLGWRPLLLMHSQRTLNRYSKLLGIDFREVLPETGPLADKLLAWRMAKKFSNYWDMVRGTAEGRSAELSGRT